MVQKPQLRTSLAGLALLCSLGAACTTDGPRPDSTVLGGGPPTANGSLPTSGAMAGSAAPAPSVNPTATNTGMQPAQPPPPAMGVDDLPAAKPPIDGNTMPPEPGRLAMDECGLDTNYAGDEYCILPPPPDQGFQLHIGPSNYDNPEARYILAPRQEVTSDFTATSSNDKPVYFYYRQFRMRNGAHHNIITSGSGGDSGLGQRIGTSNNLAEDSPKGGVIAPENTGVGIQLPAHTRITVSLHSINVTDEPQLREIWVNFWYRDASEVTEPVKEVFSPAPQAPILPGADVMINGSCRVQGNGRMLWMYGHRHANNVRFSTWRVRGTQRDLIYQGYNWEEALVLDYSSTIMNPVPDTAPNAEGGWSGILDVKTGDRFEFECHVVNNTDGTLLFTNNTYTGEMCILDAEMVGASCN